MKERRQIRSEGEAGTRFSRGEGTRENIRLISCKGRGRATLTNEDTEAIWDSASTYHVTETATGARKMPLRRAEKK